VLLNNLVNASNAIKVPVLTNSRNAGSEKIRLSASDLGIMALGGNDNVIGSNNSDVINGNRGNDRIRGRAGDDFIRGGLGNDTLIGNSGNDYLVGDAGADILAGNGGADTFVLRARTAVSPGNVDAADSILDFNPGQGYLMAIAGLSNASNLEFNASGSDTLIQLRNGNILGIVEDTAANIVENATFIVSGRDLGMTIGIGR